VPFNLSRGIYYSVLQLGARARWTRISGKQYVDPLDNGNGEFLRTGYSVDFARIRRGAYRDVRPVWGQALHVSYEHTPLSGDYRGALFHGSGTLYLPGLARHHALTLRGGFERQAPENYAFSSRLRFSRGYDSVIHKKMIMAAADYGFPLAYPDFAVGPLLYVKRINGNIFYDYGRGFGGVAPRRYRSLGAEMTFESYLLSLPAPIDLGARYVYCLDDERRSADRRHQIEMIIGIIF
jgi:hypothetical protein